MNEFQMLFKFIIDGFVSPGSFAMWAILFVGFGILGMVAERVWYLYFKCGTGSGTFMASISKYLKAGDYEKAIKYSTSVVTPLAKSVAAILQNRGKGSKAVQKSVDEVFLTEAPKITRNIPFFPTLANLATLLGLMGTIYGLMIASTLSLMFRQHRELRRCNRNFRCYVNHSVGLLVAIPTLLYTVFG